MVSIKKFNGNFIAENIPLPSNEEYKKILLFILGTSFNDHSFLWGCEKMVIPMMESMGWWDESRIIANMLVAWHTVKEPEKRIEMAKKVIAYVEAL